MTAPRVRASVAFTRNLGDYQTLRVELSAERDVPEDLSYLVAMDKLWEEVSNKVQSAIEEVDETMGHEKVKITLRSK